MAKRSRSLAESLSYVIRRERQFAGMTLIELGENMGIWGNPAQRVSQWESGYRTPSPRTLKAMEKALDLPEGSLLIRAKEIENHVHQLGIGGHHGPPLDPPLSDPPRGEG